MDDFSLSALDPTQDAQELLSLWQSAWDQPITLRDLSFSGDTWLGCRRGGAWVGALAWGSDEHDARAQQLHALVVAPDAQRQGVATRLLHAVGLLAGGAPLSAHVAAGNAAALAFLEGQGFRVVHRWLAADGQRWLRLHRKSPA